MPRPKGLPKTGGRKKGTPNKITRAFADLVDRALFDDPDETLAKLLALRDSREPQDRSTFWRIVGKRLPQLHEAKLELPKTLVRFNFDGNARDEDADEQVPDARRHERHRDWRTLQ